MRDIKIIKGSNKMFYNIIRNEKCIQNQHTQITVCQKCKQSFLLSYMYPVVRRTMSKKTLSP